MFFQWRIQFSSFQAFIEWTSFFLFFKLVIVISRYTFHRNFLPVKDFNKQVLFYYAILLSNSLTFFTTCGLFSSLSRESKWWSGLANKIDLISGVGDRGQGYVGIVTALVVFSLPSRRSKHWEQIPT